MLTWRWLVDKEKRRGDEVECEMAGDVVGRCVLPNHYGGATESRQSWNSKRSVNSLMGSRRIWQAKSRLEELGDSNFNINDENTETPPVPIGSPISISPCQVGNSLSMNAEIKSLRCFGELNGMTTDDHISETERLLAKVLEVEGGDDGLEEKKAESESEEDEGVDSEEESSENEEVETSYEEEEEMAEEKNQVVEGGDVIRDEETLRSFCNRMEYPPGFEILTSQKCVTVQERRAKRLAIYALLD